MKKKIPTISAIILAAVFAFQNSARAVTTEGQSMLNSSLRMLWGLLVVLGILLIIYYFARKRLSLAHGGGKGIIKVVEARHIMPKKSLYLVEVRGKEYLLAAGNETLSLIAPIDSTHPAQSFDDVLNNSQQHRG